MNIFKAFMVLFVLVVLSGCTSREYNLFQANDGQTVINEIPQNKYEKEVEFENLIAPNDRVSITVYVQSKAGSQQMSSILTINNISDSSTTDQDIGQLVTQKGTVRLPLVGVVRIEGLTEDEAREKLITVYQKYIRNPYVTVEIKNQRIIVVGEVNNPGIVSVTNGTMNLIEALALSGDLTSDAARHNIKLIRGDLRSPEIRNINLTDLKSIASTSLLLRPSDIIYVQPRELDGFNKAVSEIAPFWNTLSAILNPFTQRKTLIE